MKKMAFLLALCLSTGAFAQKIKEADVPAAVKNKFQALYPNVKVEKWEKEGANYEAEFEQNKIETAVVFDASGTLLETETEISVSDLPKAVSDYAAKTFPGKKIKEAAKITAANGTVTYEAEIDDADYIFDAAGNFIRKDVETDDKDDDKDND